MRAPYLRTALLLGSLSACSAAHGSGATGKEDRQVPPFTEVEVGSALKAEITAGPSEHQRVEVSGDKGLLAQVSTEVKDRRLIVRMKDHVSYRGESPLVKISAPSVLVVDASGASEVKASGVGGQSLTLQATGASRLSASGVKGESVKISASGASTVNPAGQGRSLDVHLSGASGLRGKDLRAETVNLAASGASTAEVCAEKTLDVKLSGASNAEYYCGAATVNQHLTGASSLRKK